MTILVTAASGQLPAGLRRRVAARPRRRPRRHRREHARYVEARGGLRHAASAPSNSTTPRPETIAPALEGVDTVLLVSGTDFGNRIAPHQNVIDAAKAAGVTKLVYTSAPHATTAEFAIAPEHKGTEEAIAASGVPAVMVRNDWYRENYAADVARAATTGVIASSAGNRRVASVSRIDCAEGAAVVLLA